MLSRSPATTRTAFPRGAHTAGSVGPKIATTGYANRGGKVRDPGVVADVEARTGNPARQFIQILDLHRSGQLLVRRVRTIPRALGALSASARNFAIGQFFLELPEKDALQSTVFNRL